MVLMTDSIPSQAKPVEKNIVDEFIYKAMVDEEGKGYLGKIKNPDFKAKEAEIVEVKEPEIKKKTFRKRR